MNSPWSEHSSLGEMIRAQRQLAALPMRQLAAMAGISNPYLSQIERGLRDPSDQVLNAIADSLQLSADALRPPDREDDAPSPVIEAIRADPDLTPAHRRALEESYLAFRSVTAERRRSARTSRRPGAPGSDGPPSPGGSSTPSPNPVQRNGRLFDHLQADGIQPDSHRPG